MSTPSEPMVDQLHHVIDTRFPEHPFSSQVTADNFETVIANYLTMSLAFPYQQAGAQLRLLLHYINNDQDIPVDVQITAVVGAFLTWDETGGHYAVLQHGNAGLPSILDVERFHANMLRKDIKTLVGRAVVPAFSDTTKNYVRELYFGLSSIDPVTRVAYMVAFETHAERMISALWTSVAALFPQVPKDDLVYFKTHVGGSDPAEKYHVEMTSGMIDRVIHGDEEERFLDAFEDAYGKNVEWCASITAL